MEAEVSKPWSRWVVGGGGRGWWWWWWWQWGSMASMLEVSVSDGEV